ncbi:origin recognition complex subunit 4 C-terminus-domain-containing protein, partial [Neohortaea acidophila]
QADEDESAGGGAASSHKKRQRVATAKALSYEAVRGEKKQPKDTVRRRLDLSDKKKVEPARELPSKQHEATDPMDVDEQEGADLMEIDDEEIVATPRRPAQREPVRSVPSTKAKARIDVVSMPALQDVAFSDEHLRLIQHIVADKLTWNRPTRLCNLADEHAKVSSLITQTVTAGESNSMLVIGARGSGKTTLLNDILRQQLVDHADEFHVVRLNGFIHTDDKIALREIWRQLGREMDLDEEEGASKNYADTMTRLLALLSHPAEHGTDQPGQVTKSVIFILDEFELFANHPRQTLLYNLFDIAQSRKAPIAVLGLTTRIDVAESLEKRVKSRFSHRYVHLGMAKSFAAFQESCQAAVVIDYGDLSVEEKQTLGLKSEIKEKLSKALTKDEENPVTNWNAVIEALFANDDFTNHLKRLYYTTKSVPEFQTSLLLPLATLPINPSPNSHTLLAHLLKSYQGNPLLAPDSKLTLLPTLSTLQLALLISAARLTAIHALNLVPFPQVYEEYKVLASKAKLQASAAGVLGPGASARVWGKEVARGAWEGLVEVGLVLEEGGGGEGGARVDVGLEEIGACEGVELGGWGRWCKEI